MHSETLPLALSLGSVGNCEERQPRLVAVEEEPAHLGFLPALSGANPARCKIIIASCNTLAIWAAEVKEAKLTAVAALQTYSLKTSSQRSNQFT